MRDWWRHRGAKGLLSPYLDNRLNEAQVARVEQHLATCPRCREDLITLRSTISLLGALPHAVPSLAFALPAQPPLQAPPVTTPGYLWGMRAVTAVASLAVLVLVVGDLSGSFSREVTLDDGYTDKGAQERSQELDSDPGFAESAESAPPLAAPASDELKSQESPSGAQGADLALESVPNGLLPSAASEELFPVTALTVALGSILALMAIATLVSTLRLRRSRTTP